MGRNTFRVVKKRSSLKKRRGAIGKKSKVQRRSGSRRRIKMIRGGGGGDGRNMLLIIDPQQDFVDINKPYTEGGKLHEGSLIVPNASADLTKIIEMLTKNPTAFDEIHVSLDTHTTTHIAHVDFWKSNHPLEQYMALTAEGNLGDDGNTENITFNATVRNPETQEVEQTFKIEPNNPKLRTAAYRYLTALVNKSKVGTAPPPLIWKNHCLYTDNAGNTPTEGWKLYQPLAELLSAEPFKSKVFFHEKGTNDLVEMYSIFSSEVPFGEVVVGDKELAIIGEVYPDYINAHVPEPNTTVNELNEQRNYNTDFNTVLFTRLMGDNGQNKVFVCGEAKSHCVKTSLEDMVKHCNKGPYKASQIHALTDMMSPIPTFEEQTGEAFDKLKIAGVNLIESTEFMNHKL